MSPKRLVLAPADKARRKAERLRVGTLRDNRISELTLVNIVLQSLLLKLGAKAVTLHSQTLMTSLMRRLVGT